MSASVENEEQGCGSGPEVPRLPTVPRCYGRSGMPVRRSLAIVLATALFVVACSADRPAERERRAGFGMMGIGPPGSSTSPDLLGPDWFPCGPGKDGVGYNRYGVGRMRRGGLEPLPLEPDHVEIQGRGVNFHGADRVADGTTVEMEMDDDYFSPTVLRGAPGATVTIELENEGVRTHNFSVRGQRIDVDCGVRARGKVEVAFPRSGVLLFTCKYGATSGMLGALKVR
jgi:plastocyanin